MSNQVFTGHTASMPVKRKVPTEQQKDAVRLIMEISRLKEKVKLLEKRDGEAHELVEELHETVRSLATHTHHYPHDLEQRANIFLAISIPKESDRK